MKKIALALFMIIIAVFITAFGISTFQYYQAIHADDPINPYIFVENGNVRIIRGDITAFLGEKEEYNLNEKDTIITEPASESTIHWPDRSTTQLGGNSIFAINRMRVSNDYSKIEIEATLQEGKVYTNMIRTLYPGSHMTVRVPRYDIIAGVRGTVFSMNLEENYIHSIDHSILLENQFQQKNLLLPGEIVRASNIFEKIGQGVLDKIWEDSMSLKNAAYQAIHAEKITSAWEKIKGNLTQKNYWNEFVRGVLGNFESFQALKIAEKISNLDTIKILEIPSQELQKWYQYFKIGNFAMERDFLRGAMFELSKVDKTLQGWLETLATESLWDKMQFPTLDLSHSEKILKNVNQKINIDFNTIYKHLSEKNYANEIGKELQKLFIQ